ncbi:MAG TPA: fumarate reductase cytochrome b subunit [Steroidobacteraceae bacterium]|nr:fumarate reductase cytochrome b subunit [Steroidobacteraceae bacterium]
MNSVPGATRTSRVDVAPRRSVWPAHLDVLQSASGLMLALFMWLHMLFVSSILLGNDAMWTVARAFEGYFVFGRRLPWLVALVVAAVIALFVAHAALALRKFPASYAAHRAFREHMARMRHEDTTLWYWQVATGFALFFLASLHLGTMLTRPGGIGPYESADRVWSDHLWPVYLLLLFIVELHAGVGLYRLALKWGWGVGADANAGRRRLRILKWSMTAFFVALGLATLAAYMRIGIEHAGRYGEPYVPTSFVPTPIATPSP